MRNVAFICLLMQILVCSAEEKHHPWLEAQPKETQETENTLMYVINDNTPVYAEDSIL